MAARRSAWRAVTAVVVCVALFAPGWVADFRGPNQRSGGPAWSGQVAKATELCRQERYNAITLLIDPPGWKVTLACRELVAAPSFSGDGGGRRKT